MFVAGDDRALMVAPVPAVTPTAATVATPTVIPIVAPAAAPVIYIRKNRFNGRRVDEGELHAVVRYSKFMTSYGLPT